MKPLQIRQGDDPGEFALRICQRFEGRITSVEASMEEMQATIAKVMRAEGKRSATRLTVIGAIAVALIGGLTQWQVAAMGSKAQLQTAEMARQQIASDKLSIREVIEETAKRASKATLDERDLQVDRLIARGPHHDFD